MPKKAPRRNAYFFFMIDFKRREEARGIKFGNGFQDIAVFASDAWKNLPAHQKEQYKKRADDYNKSETRNQGLPATAAKHKPPTPQMKLLSVRQAKKIAEQQFIQDLVDKKPMNDLLDHVFYLIHVNVFCKTDNDEFFPAELAISKFSLRESVMGVFHRFLNAGEIPMGYAHTVKQHTEKTHRIPLDLIKANKGYLGVYQSILNFLQESNPNEIPCLFTMFDEPFHNCSMKAVKHSLKRIWETQNTDIEEDGEIEDEDAYEKVFKVYSLPVLFFHLKNKCARFLDEKDIGFGNTQHANIELLRDIYSYDLDIACQFHQDIDNVQYCSQSYTVRWARVIQEQCCKGLVAEEEEEEEDEKKEELNLPVKEDKEQLADKIKNESPDSTAVKPERDRGNENVAIKAERDRGDENSRIKNERDRGTENGRIKDERDRGYENGRIKDERDRGYENGRIKDERDRGYEKSRVKSERDRGYDDRRHTSARESRSIKSERDRGYNDEHRSERDRDHESRRIKTERDRGYENRPIKSERDRGYESDKSKRDSTRSPVEGESSQNGAVRVKTERTQSTNDPRHDPAAVTKMKCEPSATSFAAYMKTERNELEQPRIKIEKPDTGYECYLKTEHLDIPYELMETEQSSFSNSRDPRRRGNDTAPVPSRDPRIQNVPTAIQQPGRDPRVQNAQASRDPRARLAEQIQPAQPRIKTEPLSRGSQSVQNSSSSNARIKSEPSSSKYDQSRSQRFDQNNAHDFPMPIPIKDELSPSGVKVKRERSPPSVGSSPSSSQRSIGNAHDFPMPIPIKDEFSPSNPSSLVKRETLPPATNVAERSQRSSNTANVSLDQFPLPILIKEEFPNKTQPSPESPRTTAPISIKSEPSTSSTNKSYSPNNAPVKIKSEPSTSSTNKSPSIENATIKIKTEPNESQAPSRKRVNSSSGVSNDESSKRARSYSIKDLPPEEEQIRVKQEALDYDECPPTPRRTYDDCPPTPRRTYEECPPMPRRTYDECPPTPRSTYDECPPTPRRTYDECPPTPRRTYDECPPTPRRDDVSVKIENIEPATAPRIKIERPDTYETDSIYGIKHEECDLDGDTVGKFEPTRYHSQDEAMEVDPENVKKDPSFSLNICNPFNVKIKEENVFTEDEDCIKDEMFTTHEDID